MSAWKDLRDFRKNRISQSQDTKCLYCLFSRSILVTSASDYKTWAHGISKLNMMSEYLERQPEFEELKEVKIFEEDLEK